MKPSSNASNGSEWEAPVAVVALLYFALRALYFAFTVDPSIPPDETTHLSRVQLYASSLSLPADGPNSYALGLVQHTPYRYEYVLGRLLNLNGFGLSDLRFLRLLTFAMALLTVVYGYRAVHLFSGDPIVRVLFS